MSWAICVSLNSYLLRSLQCDHIRGQRPKGRVSHMTTEAEIGGKGRKMRVTIERLETASRSEARGGAALHCAFRGHPPCVKSGGHREGCLLSSHPPGGDSLPQSWESEALEEKERSVCFCSSSATAAGSDCTSFTFSVLRADISAAFIQVRSNCYFGNS